MSTNIVKLIYLLFLSVFSIGCESKYARIEDADKLIMHKSNSGLTGYMFKDDNYMFQCVYHSDVDSIDFSIEYYDNGLIQSVLSYKGNSLHGNRIKFRPSGICEEIMPFKNGDRHGLCRMYDLSGDLRAVNLYFQDSLYFIAVYIDSSNQNNIGEELTPIVILDEDSISITDTIQLLVRFPLLGQFGLVPGKFKLRYSINTAKEVRGKSPYAPDEISLDGDDLKLSFIPLHAETAIFYCYITDNAGEILGPTVFREINILKRNL